MNSYPVHPRREEPEEESVRGRGREGREGGKEEERDGSRKEGREG